MLFFTYGSNFVAGSILHTKLFFRNESCYIDFWFYTTCILFGHFGIHNILTKPTAELWELSNSKMITETVCCKHPQEFTQQLPASTIVMHIVVHTSFLCNEVLFLTFQVCSTSAWSPSKVVYVIWINCLLVYYLLDRPVGLVGMSCLISAISYTRWMSRHDLHVQQTKLQK